MMTDDIVTRLRESHGQGCTCGAWNYSECGCPEATWREMFITEAANEIERLRNAVKVRDLQILANSKVMDAMYEELYGDV